jgi:hypothetical protein
MSTAFVVDGDNGEIFDMNYIRQFLLLSISFIMVGICVYADAAEMGCLAPSPTKLAGKDPFGPMTVRDLSDQEEQLLKTLFRSLSGTWIGTAESLLCRGIDNPSDKEIKKSTLRLAVESDHFGTTTTFLAHFYESQERVRHFETIRFFLKEHRLRVDSESGAGDIELIEITESRIRFLHRRIHAAARGAAVRKEFFINLAIDGHKCNYERLIYTQGRLTVRELWSLSKDDR